jgi:hypothetical protein
MPAARQMTTAELDRLLEDVVRRNAKSSPSQRDALKAEYNRLLGEKDKLIRSQQRRIDQLDRNIKEAGTDTPAKRRLDDNFNTNDGLRPAGQSGRKTTDTAGQAARTKAARDAAAKNPAGLKPRGDLKPGDAKAPPKGAGGNAKPIDPGKGSYKPSRGIPLIPFTSGSNQGAVQKFIDKVFPDPDDPNLDALNKQAVSGNSPLTVGLRVFARLQRATVSTLVNVTPLGAAIDITDAEVRRFRGLPPRNQNVLNSSVSGGQIATLIQGLADITKNLEASISAISEGNKALMTQSNTILQVLQIMGESVALNPAILATTASMESKIRRVNFAEIKNSADRAASIAQENKIKLGAANFTLHNQAAQLAKVKLPSLPDNGIFRVDQTGIANAVDKKLHPLFKLIDGKLPDNGIFRVDQTGIANAVDKKLHPLFKLVDGKLPDNGIFRVDQAGIAKVVKASLDPSFKSIESKFQPINLTGVFTQLSRIESKIPAPVNITGLNSQLTSISAQISGVNGAIASIPSKIPTPLAPNLTPLLNAINNIKFPTPAAPDLSIVTNQLSGLSAQIIGVNGAIAAIPSKIPTPTPTDLRPVLNAIDAVPSKIKVPAPDLTPVLRALDPIASNAADISAALSAPLFKTGMPIKAHDELLKIGQQTDSGINPTIVKSLPAMFMALSAVAYTRSGHHRLGGSFDKSVMDPAQGKTKITDMVGLQKWSFDQIDQRLGLPTAHTVIDASGRTQTKSFQSIQDAIEEGNALNIVAGQDLEVVERYLFGLTQDIQKLMQIGLQTREDVDVIIDDLGCKFKEIKRSHPTHINLTAPGASTSLSKLFEKGRVHYVGREWADTADKNQKLERISYDTQISAMSNKFELDRTNPQLPLANSRATKGQSDDVWRTFVSTMEEPPEGYVTPGNPIPDIKEIKNGNPVQVPKPTNATKKLGK